MRKLPWNINSSVSLSQSPIHDLKSPEWFALTHWMPPFPPSRDSHEHYGPSMWPSFSSLQVASCLSHSSCHSLCLKQSSFPVLSWPGPYHLHTSVQMSLPQSILSPGHLILNSKHPHTRTLLCLSSSSLPLKPLAQHLIIGYVHVLSLPSYTTMQAPWSCPVLFPCYLHCVCWNSWHKVRSSASYVLHW